MDKQQYDIFLSHARIDTEDLRALISQWSAWRFTVFADFTDPFLCAAARQERVDARVADYLRQAIGRCRLFVFVASERSASANWMPWELGLAHGTVGRVHLYLPNPGNLAAFGQREYLRLYERYCFDDRTARRYLDKWVKRARAEPVTPAARRQSKEMGCRIADATLTRDGAGLTRETKALGEHGRATVLGAGEGREGLAQRMAPPDQRMTPQPGDWPWPWLWPWFPPWR